MKPSYKILITQALLTLATASTARASAIASLWNGEKFNLAGQVLIQDSEHPEDFYILPTSYSMTHGSTYNERTGAFEETAGIKHQVVTRDGHKYSIYTIHLELDEPGRFEMAKATMLLKQKAGANARIKGLAPICGMSLGLPLQQGEANKVDPEATLITYSIKSTSEKCENAFTTTDFTLQIRAPFAREPEIANDITSETGIVLPPVELILPYKYKDRVVVRMNAKSAFEQMKTNVGLTGTWKVITGSVQANMQSMMNKLEITGQLSVDWQNPDTALRDIFMERAKEIMSKVFLKYVPEAPAQGEAKPGGVVVADKDKSSSASLFKVELGIDEATATQMGEFKIDFSNVSYNTIKAQAQLRVDSVPVSLLAPEVQSLVGEGK